MDFAAIDMIDSTIVIFILELHNVQWLKWSQGMKNGREYGNLNI